MTHILASTFLMMVAAFVIGLAVALLIKLLSNFLCYTEYGSLKHDFAARYRLLRIRNLQRRNMRSELSWKQEAGELIKYFYGDRSANTQKDEDRTSEIIKFYYGSDRY